MHEVTILLTKYSDWISSLLYTIGGHGYTHASIGLEEDSNVYYSFNYKGFAVETVEKHKRRGVRHSCCYHIWVDDQAYDNIKLQLACFKEKKENLKYTRFGLFCCLLHIPLHIKNHYFCSEFVAYLLQQSRAVRLDKSPSLYLPNHFINLIEGLPEYRLVENVI